MPACRRFRAPYHPVTSLNEALQFTQQYGYPIMIKAAMGGGGRGMRIVHEASELQEAFDRARSEAMQSFGDDEIYLEKFIANPKHIEVQILADAHGNVMHLFERDCSVQRRNQKVIEFAPAVALPIELRQKICNAAVDLMKSVRYFRTPQRLNSWLKGTNSTSWKLIRGFKLNIR